MTSEMRNICIKIYMPNLYNAVSRPVTATQDVLAQIRKVCEICVKLLTTE